MLVNEPTHESTFENSSGRSQATVKAQIPPLLIPATARPAGSWRSLRFCVFSTSGRISSRRNRAYWSESVSYSKLRFDRPLSNVPGCTNTPTVTGISFFAIRLSNTVGMNPL